MTRVRLLVLVLLAAMLVAPAAVSAPAATTTTRLQPLEQEILQALNRLRAGQGLRPLTLSPGLQSAAGAHSEAMLQLGFFEHESADGSAFHVRVKRAYPARGFASWSVGENLLYNTGGLGAAEAIEAWLGSPPHRRNMLAPEWREVGIGAMSSPSAGGIFGGEATWVVTMDFGVRSARRAR